MASPRTAPAPHTPNGGLEELRDLFDLVDGIADKELAPRAAEYEARGEFPREQLRLLGRAGLLGLPFPAEYGGGGQPFEVYVQVLERIARRWLVPAQAINVHTLSCLPLAAFGSEQQRADWLPGFLGGEVLGANCMSEPEVGSDLSTIGTTAARDPAGGDGYTVTGTKSWVSHAGIADYYNIYCRTGGPGPRGISVLLADARTPGILPQRKERKMGARSSPTAQVVLDAVQVPAERLIGRPGRGFLIALDVFDLGRMSIAACAVGLAQAALDYAVQYAKTRHQFGQPVFEFQGVSFPLADTATRIAASRALVRDAARTKDQGGRCSTAAAQAKLFATETAMQATLDAVQVLGAYGYVEDHPVERWMREAKLLQIIEGTNQIQRVAISRSL